MDAASRAANMASRLLNNNTFINTCLVGAFVTLCVRSVNQQKDIETLEARKQSLIKSNKAMKKTMWDWKQQLFAEASSSPESAVVPLARLKAIYGDVAAAPGGATAEGTGKSPTPKITI